MMGRHLSIHRVMGASFTEIVGVLPDPCLVMRQEGKFFRMLPPQL